MKSNEDVNHQDEVIEVPKLRFIPFNKPWGKSKLKDIATFINGRAYKQNELLDSGKYRVLRVGNFFTNTSWYFSDLELNHKYYAEEGDLLYTWSASFGPHIWHGEKLIYHYHIWKIELSDKTDKLFAKYLLDYDKEKILSDKNGSTMVHITKKGMEEKEVNLPSYSEQIKIGVFLKNLDNVISLHQQELDTLKQTKQGFLQKMFPKDGEVTPEIRFSEFTADWTDEVLENHVMILTGGTPKTNNAELWFPKEVPWLSSGEVNKKRIRYTDNKISKKGLNSSSARWVESHSVLIALAGQGKTRGTVAINEIPLTTNQSIAALTPKKSLDAEFLYQSLGKRYEELRMVSSGGGTRGGLNKKILSELIIQSTNIEEQVKIGKFFKKIDQVIELKEKEIESLKQTKKGFLQKMFV